jgi:hypothetical protein
VSVEGLAPSRPFGHWNLNPTRILFRHTDMCRTDEWTRTTTYTIFEIDPSTLGYIGVVRTVGFAPTINSTSRSLLSSCYVRNFQKASAASGLIVIVVLLFLISLLSNT